MVEMLDLAEEAFQLEKFKQIESSKKFLKDCENEADFWSLLKNYTLIRTVLPLLESKFEEVLFPTLQGIKVLSERKSCCVFLRKERKLITALINLNKRYHQHDNLFPLISNILSSLNFSTQNDSGERGGSNIKRAFSISSKPVDQHFTPNQSVIVNKNLRYTILVPGISHSDIRSIVEETLLGVKGLISFCSYPRREMIELNARSSLQLEILAKTLSVHANITSIWLVKKSKEATDELVPIDAGIEEDVSTFDHDVSCSINVEKALVDTSKFNRHLHNWSSMIGRFVSKALFW